MTPRMSGSRLSVSGLAYTSPSRHRLVQRMDFDVAAGECVAIIGPNGAGKTTLLRLLAGRLTPTEGSVSVGDDLLSGLAPAERARRVAVMAQGESPTLSLKVADYVALGRIPWRQQVSAGVHGEAVQQALRVCGLESKAQRPLNSLSGGESQRAGIARAIAQQPGVLLLDEPTNHLDLRARCDMLDLVRGLGVTVITVLHELSLLARFADRVLVIDQGCFVAMDRPERAMTPALVRRVFQIEVIELQRPAGGPPVMVFDHPVSGELSLQRHAP